MSASSGAPKLQRAIKDLRVKWQEVRDVWTDKVAEEYEENHVAPLEMQVMATLNAMERMSHVLEQARTACG